MTNNTLIPHGSQPESVAELARFSAIFPPERIIETRCVRGEEAQSNWHRARELPSLAPMLAKANANGFNIYCGPNPRKAFGAKGDESVAMACTFFADFDHCGQAEAIARIRKAGFPPPNLLVWSGHGVHCYWIFSHPITDLAAWSAAQKKIIDLLGSDRVIFNAERIMRLPGFLNLKAEPTPCYIIHCDCSNPYDSTDLLGFIDSRWKPPPPALPRPPARRGFTADANKDGQYWLGRALQRAQGEGRNNSGLWLAAQLRDAGLTRTDAEGWLLQFAADAPAGEHRYTEAEALASVAQAFKRPARARACRKTYEVQSGRSRWFISSHRNLGVSA